MSQIPFLFFSSSKLLILFTEASSFLHLWTFRLCPNWICPKHWIYLSKIPFFGIFSKTTYPLYLSLLYPPLWSYFRLCHCSLETLNAAHTDQVEQSKDFLWHMYHNLYCRFISYIRKVLCFDIQYDERREMLCKLKSVLDIFRSKLFSIMLGFVWFYSIWFCQEPHFQITANLTFADCDDKI